VSTKNTLTTLLLTLLLAVAHPTAAQRRWLSYEPETVELAGRLVIQTKYGPPNFGEDPKTDQKLRVPILILTDAVSMIPDRGDGFNAQPAYGIKQVQLVFINAGITYKNLIGQPVVVKGMLFHAFTGHHYTDVLLQVNSLERKPAGYGQQPFDVCQITTSGWNLRKPQGTSNSLLAEFGVPAGLEATNKSLKHPESGLIINTGVERFINHRKGQPGLIRIAISVAATEQDPFDVVDSAVASTHYIRGWGFLCVAKQMVVGDIKHTITLYCGERARERNR
jgi:hypothetical protein